MGAQGGAGNARALLPAARVRRAERVLLRQSPLTALLRRSAARRDRAGPGERAEAAAAGRANRRDEPSRVGAADRLHAQAARRAEPHHPADRARHEGGHGRLRAHHRPGPRREDRRGPALGGPRELAGDRGIPGKAGLIALALLEVDEIHTYYGAIEALKGVSLTVDSGEVVTLIGSNGAGKSTTLRSISGLTPASRGKIVFDGEEITRVPAHEVVGHGVALSPEGRHCFPRMTVRENLDLGAHRRRGGEVAEDLERVYSLFPRLKEREKQRAGTMSGGEQQMLAIGRALMARPQLLMLDEPSMGIAPILVQRIYETIGEINRSGVAILLVEQNANYALDISRRGYVLETGRVVLSNDSARLRDDPEVQRAYLGA